MIEISCTLVSDDGSVDGSGDETADPPERGEISGQAEMLRQELSSQILDALVDAHGETENDGHPQAWLRMRRIRRRRHIARRQRPQKLQKLRASPRRKPVRRVAIDIGPPFVRQGVDQGKAPAAHRQLLSRAGNRRYRITIGDSDAQADAIKRQNQLQLGLCVPDTVADEFGDE